MCNVRSEKCEDRFIRGGAACRRSALPGRAARAARIGALFLLSVLGGGVQVSCGATCDRIEKDRKQFLARKGTNTDTHVEVTIPFAVANRLVAPHVLKVKPIAVNLSGLGNLAGYFGELSIAPTRVTIEAGGRDYVGFHLDFDVQRDGNRVFAMYLESEVRPEIDIEARKVVIGFTPEVLEKARPGLSKDAKGDLSEVIYSQIPAPARLLIPRSAVDGVVDSALKRLIDGFYSRTHARLLPMLSKMSRVELALPNVPLAAARISSSTANGGYLRLEMTTSLPVKKGVAASRKGKSELSRGNITLRTSGSVAAELVNWSLAKGKLPARYDAKGKPQENGELRPGLDWIAGDERPMKIYLWDLEKPCMRLNMSAKPAIAVVGDNVEIKAENIETDGVEASAFTRVGAWFRLLWKDAMNVNKKSPARIRTIVAGQEMEAVVKKAAMERDELVVEVSLTAGASKPH
jgi:hypothetical protein